MIQDTTTVTYIGVIFFKGVGEIREYESDSVPWYVCVCVFCKQLAFMMCELRGYQTAIAELLALGWALVVSEQGPSPDMSPEVVAALLVNARRCAKSSK